MRAGRHDSDSDSDSLAERANLLSDNGHGHGAAQAGRHEGTATAGNDADYDGDDDSGDSVDSSSTISASLAMMDRLNDEKRRLRRARDGGGGYTDDGGDAHHADSMDLDDLDFAAVERGTRGADVHGRDGDGDGDCRCCCSSASAATHASPSLRRRLAVWIAVALIATVCVVGVISAMLASRSASPVRPQGVGRPDQPLDSLEHSSSGNGTGTGTDTDTGNSTLKTITFDDAWRQEFRATSHSISWIAGPGGEDGLMLVRNLDTPGEHVCVEDVTTRVNGTAAATDGSRKTVLMQDRHFTYENQTYEPDEIWPNRGLTTLLLASGREKTWRHSFTAVYWLFDVATQTAQPLDPAQPYMRVQLASWSPAGDAVVFTRRNNMFLRRLGADDDGRVVQITHDGGPELFYGVPDWVYEEEVFTGNSVTWWSRDGRYVAFLRTNESAAPEYPVQYFLSSHSDDPSSGHSLENYPDTLQIKYPKAGAPNPVVTVQFYDVAKREVFSVAAADGAFADDDRLIIEVLWAGAGSVLVRETNRESDVVKVVLIDADARTAAVVRSQDLQALDGGWVEPSQFARYVPARPAAGRPHDGYVDIVVHENHNHLALFSPVNSSEPILLTRGDWEVVSAAPGVDVERGLVYFLAARDRPWKRHVYSVRLDGSDMQQLTDTSEDAYYAASFSQGAGYALLHYQGPGVPWQKVISTPANERKYEDVIEENAGLQKMVAQYDMPTKRYYTFHVGGEGDDGSGEGFDLPVMEILPPGFDAAAGKQYPVLFHPYAGPGSQSVDMKFTVDFQSYAAAALGIIVVTVDGRGTGYIGRAARCAVRGELGALETQDQIAVARAYAGKPWVDARRLAIWGWSYGGFMALKTLERDAGRTFGYGVAVAPVTDFRFYDSIYTERYMHTPQHNAAGYARTAVANASALAQATRFLVMHGTGDDNVHLQNTLALLDKLDLAGVENYDVHFFPDSDHSIWFHNANRMVYHRLNDWLINAFNGEWLRTSQPVMKPSWLRRRVARPVGRWVGRWMA